MHGNGVGGSPLKLGVNNSVIIQRAKYNAGSGLRAWLSASNALGSVWSDEVTFDMDAIVQPSAPLITGHEPKPLEILWEAKRDAGLPAQWLCKVQYRRPCDPDWTEVRCHEANFVLEDPVPFTTYTFRVRCWLSSVMRNYVVMSDWSEEYNAKTPPAVPLGKLDVWSVCEPSLEAPTCKILWKEMPVSQAQGKISSYMVRVRLHNGVENVTSCAPQTCDQEESCFQSIPLKVPITEVKAVSVAASTTQGESIPSFVALPRTDVPTPTVKPKVRGARNELSVSWCVPTWFSERVQEFVVQHKPIKLHRILCLNWVKVNKSQSSVVVKGPLWDYTAYNVSLFAVVNNCSHLLGYSIAYTVQKVPPKVTDLQIMNISSSTVDLTWTPISLNTSPGLILYYLVHLDNGSACVFSSVVNVSRHMSSVQLRELKPGQHYDVWISAMTEAGEGEKATTSFTTKTPGTSSASKYSFLFHCHVSVCLLLITYLINKDISFMEIPDPNNSSLFKGENLHAQMSSSPVCIFCVLLYGIGKSES
uniref:Fibronectin type-III domain-containing protein n=1 Tax=Electrophorus electricus TaxID=8005 RepID=A0A4W4EL09_ELEEL